jgi:hypothetical protein
MGQVLRSCPTLKESTLPNKKLATFSTVNNPITKQYSAKEWFPFKAKKWHAFNGFSLCNSVPLFKRHVIVLVYLNQSTEPKHLLLALHFNDWEIAGRDRYC